MTPERWLAGAPQVIDEETGSIYPMYGSDGKCVHHFDWAFTDVDAEPTNGGPDKGIFDTYKRYGAIRHFSQPDWVK